MVGYLEVVEEKRNESRWWIRKVWRMLYKVIVEEVKMQLLKDLRRGFKEVNGGPRNVHHV